MNFQEIENVLGLQYPKSILCDTLHNEKLSGGGERGVVVVVESVKKQKKKRERKREKGERREGGKQNLQGDKFVINFHLFSQKISPDCGLILCSPLFVDVSIHQ